MSCCKWVVQGLSTGMLLVAIGCGPGDDGMNRQPVSGRATVDGAPIPTGSISFEPLVSGGLGSGAMIQSGSFKIEQKDGLPPGKYLVRITGSEGAQFSSSPGKMPGDEEMPETKQLVPPNWKEEVEVKADGPNEFNFAIETKSAEKD